MKKRTGVERAVIVMAVVVVLLAIALIVVNAAGIRIHKSAPEAPAATNLPQFPFSDEPELILGSGQTPSRDAQQAVSVGGEDKTMQLVTGSFAQRGGPDEHRHRQRHARLDEVCRHTGRVRQREVRAIRHAGRQRSGLGERHGQLQSALVVQHVQRGVRHCLAHRVGDVHLHEQGLVGHHLEQGVGNREDVRLHHVDGTHRRGSAGCRCR